MYTITDAVFEIHERVPRVNRKSRVVKEREAEEMQIW